LHDVLWLFAALNTIEPPIVEREAAMLLKKEKAWHGERQTLLDAGVRERLHELSAYLGHREWLDGTFSAGDLLT
jgi:glutathione S-transferase